MRKNTAKSRMLEGEPAVGAMVGLGSALAAQILSQAGFHHVLVDCQHGIWDENSAMAAFQAICGGPAVPMARVRQNDFGAIGGLLDRGAMGIVVPLINTAEEARAAAAAMRYPPQEGRSLAILAGRMHGDNYWAEANDELLLAVQIESAQAVENVEEIMAVDGVDACWIGPGDLAASMGVDVNTPEGRSAHDEAIRTVLRACKKSDKIPGICAIGVPTAQRWIDEGYLFVTAASDYGYLLVNGPETVKELGLAD